MQLPSAPLSETRSQDQTRLLGQVGKSPDRNHLVPGPAIQSQRQTVEAAVPCSLGINGHADASLQRQLPSYTTPDSTSASTSAVPAGPSVFPCSSEGSLAPGINDWGMGVDDHVIRQHLDAFFEHVHPIPGLSIIHRGKCLQTWRNGTHNPRLLRAICGVSARFVSVAEPNHAARAAGWLEEAEACIIQMKQEPLRTDIAALLLIAFNHGVSGRFLRLMAVTVVAVKLAYIMRLNYESPGLPFSAQEFRRRIFWSLWIFDTISGGCGDSSSISTESIHLQLPSSNRSYILDDPVSTGHLGQSSNHATSVGCGVFTCLVRMLDIRRRVQR